MQIYKILGITFNEEKLEMCLSNIEKMHTLLSVQSKFNLKYNIKRNFSKII